MPKFHFEIIDGVHRRPVGMDHKVPVTWNHRLFSKNEQGAGFSA